jgi:predicted permease
VAVVVLTGFAAIVVVIACGVGLAHAGVVDERAQRMLSEVSFRVALPALLLLTISGVEVGSAMAENLVASGASLLTTAALYAVGAGVLWGLDAGSLLIGALASSYVNAGNLGLAVAAYVVGDTAVIVPTLLVQVVVVQPLALAWLDRHSGHEGGALHVVRRVLLNPLTIASALGVLIAVTRWELPAAVDAPLQMLAGLAIPAMLLAYGAALRLSPPLGRSGHTREVALAAVLKLAVMPALAAAIAVAFGLEGPALLGVVITAALPTAQNIFLHATRYGVGEDVSRETILLTTLCSLPVALLVALLLG